MTHLLTRMLILASICGLAGIGLSSTAGAQSAPETGETRDNCTIDTPSGASHSAPVPGTLTLNWDDTPLFISCVSRGKPPIRKVLPKPANGWVPISTVIDGIAVAFLDAAPGYPLKRPSAVTLTLYPAEAEDYEAKDTWYQTRRTQIEERINARLKQLSHNVNQCKFVASCEDEQDELTARKADSLEDLNRVRDVIKIRNGALILRTSKRTICLSQVSDIMWRAGDCAPDILSGPTAKPKTEMTRVKVDGKIECLFRVKSTVWEARPCPD
jgi:hypothetical protein